MQSFCAAIALRVEEALQAFDVLAISFTGNLVGTGRGALADGVEQAGTEESFARVLFENFEMAGAELERALQVLDRIPETRGGSERAVEFCAGGVGLAGDIDSGIIVARGVFEIRIGFVIEEAGVESRLDILDKAVLGEERLNF